MAGPEFDVAPTLKRVLCRRRTSDVALTPPSSPYYLVRRSFLAHALATGAVSSWPSWSINWWIQAWVDQVAIPHWPKVGAGHGCKKQSTLDVGCELSFKSFWPLFYIKMTKRLSASLGGPRAAPLTESRGLSWLREAVCLGHGVKLSFKSLTFGLSFVSKRWKGFQLHWLAPGQPPLTESRGSGHGCEKQYALDMGAGYHLSR